MRCETLLWRIAVACSALLLFTPMTGRTSWSYVGGSEMRAEGGTIIHFAGWDWIVPLAGVIAVVSLLIGRRLRPGIKRPVQCSAIASLGLSVATAAALGHWHDLIPGSLAMGRWVISPAPAVGYFAGISAVGLVASLVLLGAWLGVDKVKHSFE
jgi:hypothetical protein